MFKIFLYDLQYNISEYLQMEHHMEHVMAKIDANDCGSTSILQHTAKTYGYGSKLGPPIVGWLILN